MLCTQLLDILRTLSKSIEQYKNINIIARKKLNTAKALKILDKLLCQKLRPLT